MTLENLPVKSNVKRSMRRGGSWAGIVLAALAAACGDGSGDPGVASGGGDTSDRSGDTVGGPRGAEPLGNTDRFRSNDDRDDDEGSSGGAGGGSSANDDDSSDDASGDSGDEVEVPATNFAEGPPAGNPEGDCTVPSEGLPVDTSGADNIVGDGTRASCTADAFIQAVERGGLIRFACGPEPITITLDRPAKVKNDASDDVVIDGQGKVTLSGGGTTRILYMNTCDSDQVWTTDHCDNQPTPRLTVQNLTFVDADSRDEDEYDGGGAIWVRGGRFKVINSRFFNNRCADTGPDVGGGGLRVFSQFEGQPVFVVGSTFGGADGLGNVCSNGGGLSSIDVSWNIINSLLRTTARWATAATPPRPVRPAVAAAAPSTMTATR